MIDRLVSTAVLNERLEAIRAEVEGQKRMRAASDPFFTHAAWLIAEFEEAIRLAALEYRPTVEVSKLTGWNPQTLRRAARDVLAGRDPGDEWKGLLVKRMDGGEYSFAVVSVPVKRTGELRRAS